MRTHRPQDAANNPRGHRFGAGVVRVLSVTAVAAMASTMWAGVASAATKHATTTTISASAAPHWVGAVVKLSATVKGSGSVPTGTVTFKRGTVKLCSGRLSGGKTSCNVRFGGAGTKAVKGYYSGNATHKASTSGTLSVAVRRSATTTTIKNVSAGTVDVGKKYTFQVTVSTPAGTPAASGTVKLVASALVFGPPPTAAYSCTATVTAGKGSCTTGALPNYGIYGYVATYTGNAAHTASATSSGDPFELDVQNVTSTTITPSSAAAGAVTLTGFVDADGANITTAVGGTGSVTFEVGTSASTMAVVCKAVPLTTFNAVTGNSATCTDTLTAGSYFIEAVFSGDVVNTASDSGTPASANLTVS